MKYIIHSIYRLLIIIFTFGLVFSCGNLAEDAASALVQHGEKNLCPQANGDNYTIENGGILNIDFNHGVLSNDADPGGGAMASTIVVQTKKGTLSLKVDGSFTYSHDGSGAGEDDFIYAASTASCDNTSEPEMKSMAKVTITITEAASNSATSNIYVAGSYTTNIDMVGCVFTDKNGDGEWEANILPNSFQAHDLTMYNGKLYVVGDGGAGGNDPVLWIDGVPTILDYPNKNKSWGYAGATGVAIDESNGDVYISGTYSPKNGEMGSCYWKNGVHVPLTTNADSEAFDIAVKNGKAITVGWFMSHHKIYAAKWIDKARTTIHKAGDGEAYEVMVVNNKTYIAGWAGANFSGMPNWRAAIWEGNSAKTAKRLKNGKHATLMAQSGWPYDGEGRGMGYDKKNNKFWIAGSTNWVNIGKWPGLWKVTPGGGNVVYDLVELPDGSKPGCEVDNTGNLLPGGTCEYGETLDVAVSDDGVVYAVGMTTGDDRPENMWHPNAKIWINGVKYPLRDHSSDGQWSEANQIYIDN